MEQMPWPPAPGTVGRGWRIAHRERRRRRLSRILAIVGGLLLLGGLAAGLWQAQHGVAELAGPQAPVVPAGAVAQSAADLWRAASGAARHWLGAARLWAMALIRASSPG